MKDKKDILRKIFHDRRGRDFNIIITSENRAARPKRAWKCTECGSWTAWPGYPMVPCFHCNMLENDVDGPLYVPR